MTYLADLPRAAQTPASVRRLIIAATVGITLEWLDMIVYGFFAVPIARNFFPGKTDGASVIIVLGTFAISYLARPVGGLILGSYADRHGRKSTMLISITVMMIGTAIIALMPPYAQIGVVAPIGVLIARLVQGFAAGGEFGSSTALLVEHVPARSGFMASWQFAAQGLTTVLASLFGLAIFSWLRPEQVLDWGWRLPFLFGLLVGPVGLYIRRHIGESVAFERIERVQSPLREVFSAQKARVAMATGALILSTCAAALILYLPTFAIRELHLPANIGFGATLAGSLIMTFVTPCVGHVSDRVGRIRLMLSAGTLFLLTVPASFALLDHAPSVAMFFIVTLWICLLKAAYFGALPALMSEAFPVETRATGLAVSYNIGSTIVGGFTPIILAALIGLTQGVLVPCLYIVACSAISLVALVIIRRKLGIR